MSKDIIIDRGEFSKASNRILAYGNFLANSLVEFQKIILEMEELGYFSDEKATSNLNEIVNGLQPYGQQIVEECEEIEHIIKEFLEEVEEIDDFRFPYDIMQEVIRNTALG